MSKLIVMTDLHVTTGAPIIGIDPLARVEEALRHAGSHHPDAAGLVVTGDLVHSADQTEYDRLAPVLATAPWPVWVIPGNHDRRAPLRRSFPNAPRDAAGFMQAVVDLPDARLILLDTLDETDGAGHSGFICSARMEWLSDQLAQADTRPTLVFLHHPPFRTGFDGMDAIGLRNAKELRAVLHAGGVAHVFSGHIHRTITASVDGLSLSVFKSPCHQMPMLLGEPGHGHSIAEPGAYGIVCVNSDGIVVFTEDFSLPPSTNGQH
ncbi:phosphodiesterase [Pontivivens insulae]|uniref:3',5'-cyclic adenosine monophosphate phosphodiesterase CpdA n=1 Tax=Pontivivens insulae TaxID=1639689 RepID=A0A2R8AC02_9RHOB|nr:phosphodiesterase [Pontivivens insulae]RED11036.1 3',5'-cyclic AMP phosphodiesterase CpdA [Pontivivens insulae]SPF29789.1 3',5'-cyclic adenosine monophosphate phosphodiesterase CpdA [Pontivivens insulae]